MERKTLEKSKGRGGMVVRYCDKEWKVTRVSDPNEAMYNIAALINEGGSVLGMMSHPERCVEPFLGSEDGRKICESIIRSKDEKR